MKIKNLLVSQPKPTTEKSPYFDMAEKYGLKIDFRPFIKVEPVMAKEFRQQKVSILDHTAVIFTARTAIDHFFRLCEELRIAIPETMKYFCINEQVALYLQRYIVYRKRKIFHSTTGKLDDLVLLIQKHASETFLVPVSDVHKDDLLVRMDEKKLNYTKAVMYCTVSNDFKPDEPFDYDMLVFFSPSGIASLLKNFPNFVQGEISIGCFGATTAKAVRDAGLRLDVEAPTVVAPSMAAAIDMYIKENHKAAKKINFINTRYNTLFSGRISTFVKTACSFFMADHLFKFPKQERLCSESRINELFLNGESFMSYPVRVVWVAFKAVENPEIRVVMSVPKKKLRHAVDRNRVKRLLRESYRLNKQELWQQANNLGYSIHIAFIWIPTEVLDYAKVEKKMKDALVKLQNALLNYKVKDSNTSDESLDATIKSL